MTFAELWTMLQNTVSEVFTNAGVGVPTLTALWAGFTTIMSRRLSNRLLGKDRQITGLEHQINELVVKNQDSESAMKVSQEYMNKVGDLMLKIAMGSKLDVETKMAIAKDWFEENNINEEATLDKVADKATTFISEMKEEVKDYLDKVTEV